ncbi:MAG: T9SS type A sorting domain-containing protein [Saprospiraceae bacterium]|jgi:hypothetical protein|nr:T9SS type A sorting domain-containing protein [Saprospiraceae bacterium]
MKKTRILWVLAAFQLFSRASAQVTDFAPVGAKWYYSEQAFFPPPYGEFPHVVEVVGKEMYQGKLCSKLTGIGTAFPNPAKDLIHVQIATDVRNCFFRLFHQTGQLVHQTNVRVGMNIIETTGLNPGLYVWEIFHEDKPVKHGRIAIGLK